MARQRVQAKSARREGLRQDDDNSEADNKPVAAAAARGEAPASQAGTVTSHSAALEWLLMLVLVGWVVHLLNIYQTSLPIALSTEQAGIRGFSEQTALGHVVALSNFGPHPVGSAALERAFEYVYSELIEIKETADRYVDVEIDVFEPNPGCMRLDGGLFYGKTIVYTNYKHLVVRVSPIDFPEAKDNAILVSSHIDTVFSGSGAGDCSSCVSVMLELVRTLSHWANGFKHSVIFYFNTGEEEGLIGAYSFVTQHSWNVTVRTAIDVESMGIGGRSALFQAGPDKYLLNLYAKVAKYPSAQILSQDVFHSGLVKSATDFQVYREVGGLSGLDFAYLEHGAVYHTKNDKIGYLAGGSLQQLGDDLLALLQAAALSDELPSVRTNYSGTAKMDMVYFDILGKWMVTYPFVAAKILQGHLVLEGSLVTLVSVSIAGLSGFIEFGLSIVTLILTWICALVHVLIVATILPALSSFPTPYLVHPWLAAGLFGVPAVFGALLGHALGRSMLMRYLLKQGHTQEHASYQSERWLFKAGFVQWIAILALGTWFEVGSSYIAAAWIICPAIAYGIREVQISPQQEIRSLQRLTLWLSLSVSVMISAHSVIRFTSVVIANLVRFDRNPGTVPLWAGNALVGVLITAFVCLMLMYMFPYAHRSGGLPWILVGLAAVFCGALITVNMELLPTFTEHLGRGMHAVHVVDTTGVSGDFNEDPLHYISLSSPTAGDLEKEMAILNDGNFVCGKTSIDFVSFNVKYGCKKNLYEDPDLSKGQPTLLIENDEFVDGRRKTIVSFNSGSGRRWNLGINTDTVQEFKLETEGDGVLVPGGTIVGVDGWHNVQFTTDANGPSKFQLTLFWHRSLEEKTVVKVGEDAVLLKVRTDVNTVSHALEEVLSNLPNWCVLFGKSTAPYTLGYLTDLKVPRTS